MNPIVKYTLPTAVLGLALVSAAPPPADPPLAKPITTQNEGLGDAQVLVRLESQAERAKTLGALATEKATSADVKQLGKDVLNEANKTKARIENTAKSLGVALNDVQPTPGAAPAPMERLRELSGIAFDKAVVNELQANHAALVDLLAESSSHASSNDVKSLASSLLSGMERQRDEARRLMRELASRSS